jgi:hypothetical protein
MSHGYLYLNHFRRDCSWILAIEPRLYFLWRIRRVGGGRAQRGARGGSGPRGWGGQFLATEIHTHSAYGIPPAVFGDFLPIVAAVIRDGCGNGFTPAMAAAWELALDRAAQTLAALPGSSNEARVIDVDDVLPPVGERGLPFPMR